MFVVENHQAMVDYVYLSKEKIVTQIYRAVCQVNA